MKPTDGQLEDVRQLQAEVDERYAGYLAAMQHRDDAIRALIASGVSMYRIAQAINLSESAIRVIRDRERNS